MEIQAYIELQDKVCEEIFSLIYYLLDLPIRTKLTHFLAWITVVEGLQSSDPFAK